MLKLNLLVRDSIMRFALRLLRNFKIKRLKIWDLEKSIIINEEVLA